MANDRVFLQCLHCGGWKMLLKFFPGSLEMRDPESFEAWIDSHGPCHPNFQKGDLRGDPGFKILAESSPEFSTLDWAKQNILGKGKTVFLKKLPSPPGPMREGEPYCAIHMIAIDSRGECVVCEWIKNKESDDGQTKSDAESPRGKD